MHKKISKAEYWKIWELTELLSDLRSAVASIDKGCTGHTSDTIGEFRERLLEEIDELEHWNGSPITDFIFNSFSPEGKWREYVHLKDGDELGKRILERIKRWRKGTGYKA